MYGKPKPRSKKKRITVSEETYNYVYDRDKGICVLCGRPDVHLHHIMSREKDNINDVNNAVLLCYSCHLNIVHKNLKKYRPILKQYIDEC